MKRIALIAVAVIGVGAAVACRWPRSDGPSEVRLPGTVEVQEVRLGSKVGGRVAAVKVREGQLAEAGDVLVTLETPELTARRDRARARVDSARAAAERAEYGARAEEIAEARAAADSARAKYERVSDRAGIGPRSLTRFRRSRLQPALRIGAALPPRRRPSGLRFWLQDSHQLFALEPLVAVEPDRLAVLRGHLDGL